MRRLITSAVLAALTSVVVAGHDPPALTADQQILVDLNDEAERLATELQVALEEVHTLTVQKNALMRAYNILRLSLVRERSTPTVEGYIFDWTVDPDTGQRRGLVRIVVTAADPPP